MPRITAATAMWMSALLMTSQAIFAQEINNAQWAVATTHDDFTDEVSNVAARVLSENNDAMLAIVCYPDHDRPRRSTVAAMVALPGEYLGSDRTARFRWRVDQEAHGEGTWSANENRAMTFMAEPISHQFVADIVSAPASASMIFELVDFSGDRHRGKVTLSEAKNTVRQVLEACGKAQE